jgi:hypothetical protein
MIDKVLVTNQSVLRAKYGAGGLKLVLAAVNGLVKADKARGISTRLVALDDSAAMKKLKAKPVLSPSSCSQNKLAVDGVFKALEPDYLLILGAHDVVPHQDLVNPVFVAGDDDDRYAYGDLPYACDVPYSRAIAKFVGPTRVVSRLPDLTGASNPAHLIKLLQIAARAKPRARSEFSAYFALTAEVWSESTELSVSNIVGEGATIRRSPPQGPKFTAAALGARTHFINCHGGPADPQFYGQRGANQFPVALSSKAIKGTIKEGTIAAVECCYGGELYSQTLALDTPICQHYLAQGAHAYLGSTTIAYGPASGNGAADLITQFFLIELLSGASVGLAGLTARQKFVEQTGQMDAVDLKTLAQFCVYGDASVHPVLKRGATHVPKALGSSSGSRVERRERRTKLAQSGEYLRRTKATAGSPMRRARPSKTTRSALSNIASEFGVDPEGFVPYKVNAPRSPLSGKRVTGAQRYHILVAPASKTRAPARTVAIVAKEADGRVVGYRVYYGK